jgi:Fibronectin type III domain
MKTITRVRFSSARVNALLWGAVFAGSFSAAAVAIPPGGLAVNPSGHDLILSFPTTSPEFYTVQTSPDLQRWTNCQPGTPGDGTVKTVTMTNALLGGQGFYRLLIQTPTKLLLPQSTAFAILGHSCGGIQEQVSAGFDVTNGYPAGVVALSTSCGGSGRDGGGHTTKYTASAWVTWDFAGNVISATALSNGVTVNPTTPTDGFGDVIYNIGAAAYLIVPAPAAPTGVTATQSGDQFQVSWTPHGVNPVAVTSSTLTATPVNSTVSILTTTVTGPAASGVISSLEPQTAYQLTVVNTTIGGSGPASTPISVSTDPATIPPSAPTNLVAQWAAPNADPGPNTLIATWQAADPGNSPIDQYLVTITGSDGAGTFTQTVSGTTLSASFPVDSNPNWSVTVQAQNAAGWGPVSTTFHLGGL